MYQNEEFRNRFVLKEDNLSNALREPPEDDIMRREPDENCRERKAEERTIPAPEGKFCVAPAVFESKHFET